MKVCKRCKETTDNFSASSVYYCRICVSELNKLNREGQGRPKILEGKRRYYQENKEKCDETIKRWKESNKEKALSYHRTWAKRNPDVVNKHSANRRARVRDLTPELTKEQQEQIDYLYWLAKDLRSVSGEEYHVDHIFPLAKGGLHEPSNLQILPKDLNLQKSTKVDF
jgi:hypothetical protein